MINPTQERIAVLVMAAGQSSRFGGCKLLADIGGKPLLAHSITCAQTSALGDTFVVTGRWHQEIAQWLGHQSDITVQLLRNPNWQQGLGGSIAYGVKELADRYDGILIMLADQIGLTPQDLQALHNAKDGRDIACAAYNNRRGAPALFGHSCFSALQQLEGDQGAKQLLYHSDFGIAELPCSNAALDIDTPADITHWQNSLRG